MNLIELPEDAQHLNPLLSLGSPTVRILMEGFISLFYRRPPHTLKVRVEPGDGCSANHKLHWGSEKVLERSRNREFIPHTGNDIRFPRAAKLVPVFSGDSIGVLTGRHLVSLDPCLSYKLDSLRSWQFCTLPINVYN